MNGRISVLGRALCAAVVCVSLVSAASADVFAEGTANEFSIDFVTISGDAGDLGSWPAGSGYTFTGVNRDDYRIGTYEVTNDQWNKFKAELGVPVTGDPSYAYNESPYWTGTNVPTNEVSWYEAAQFVNWLNTSTGHQAAYKFTGTQGTSGYALDTWSAAEADNGTNLYRHKDAFYYLPTENEWVKAGYWNGTSLQTYSNASPGDLVSGSPDPAKWNYSPSAGSEPWDVGSGAEELNGTFDMMGNVWEWMESPYSDTSYGTGSNRGLRGGSYYGSGDDLASSDRYDYIPDSEDYGIGFRVASEVPEPASLSVLAIGGLALLRRKRAAATVVLLMMAVAVVLLPSAPVSADLLVSTYGGTSIHRVSADGSTVSEFSSLSDQKTRAMCWGPEGNLFVSIVTTSKVLEFDRTTGDLLGEGRLREVYGMVAGADGALYGSYRSGWNSTHGLRRFDPDEMDESFFAHTEEGASPWGITLGPDDNLYVACRGNSTVIRVDPQTATITDFIPSISQPRNVVFGPDGNLYVTRHDNRSVERYNGQTGEFIDVFVDPQSGGLANPQGLIFPGDGYLYVANAGGVHRYDAVTGNFDSVFCDDPLLEGSKDILFIPEPATMTLLALGGLALLRRRRTSTAASLLLLVGLGMALLPTGSASAVNIETVPVGNPGNAGELSGSGAGGYGPDRICGRVDYEYNIGKYEVTAGQYTEFLNAVAATDTYGLYDMNMDSSYRGCKIQRSGSSGSYTYSVAGDWANRPVNYVSWGDAARFANWLHNGQPTGAQGLSTTEDGAYFLNGATSNSALLAVSREADWTWAITSEDEWYKAAYHKNDGVTGNYFNYPTSSDTAPGYVNNSGNLSTTGNPFVEGGTDPGNYATYDGDGGTNGIGSPYYRTVVGEWENSESPYDTFDQGGNVWEWNEAILSGSYRGRRGGSFYNSDDSLHASSRYYRYGFPTKEDDYLGFRVSEVPEPFTFGLLSLGGLALLRRRKA